MKSINMRQSFLHCNGIEVRKGSCTRNIVSQCRRLQYPPLLGYMHALSAYKVVLLFWLLWDTFQSVSWTSRLRSQSSSTQLYAVKPKIAGSSLPDLSQKSFPVAPVGGYDLIVVGSGPGGESIAVTAAQLGARVAVIEKRTTFGGPTGLTSKAVREAAKRISKAVDQVGGDRRKQIRGLWRRRFPVLKTEAEVLQAAETRDKLRKNKVDLYLGEALFSNKSSSSVSEGSTLMDVNRGTSSVELLSRHVCIATGSRPSRPTHLKSGAALPFTKDRVVDATEVGSLQELPNAVVIIGGGVIAVEYELAVGVTLICAEDEFMPFLEDDLRRAMLRRMVRDRVLIVNEEIDRIELDDDTEIGDKSTDRRVDRKGISVVLKRNPTRPSSAVERRFKVDLVVYSGGRNSNSEGLECENVGIDIGKYGRIEVDPHSRRTTSRRSIYAIGDVTGPPGLASAAQQQGRLVAQALFQYLRRPVLNRLQQEQLSELNQTTSEQQVSKSDIDPEKLALFGTARDAPMTLWSIPEMASVGMTFDAALKLNALPIDEPGGTLVEGFAYFKDMARGRLSGDLDGFLKLVAVKASADIDGRSRHRIVGVQIFGEGANELIQLGSVLVHSGATLEQVSSTPFAAVTLSGLFQMASDDCLARLALVLDY